jgi:hypothetical protein
MGQEDGRLSCCFVLVVVTLRGFSFGGGVSPFSLYFLEFIKYWWSILLVPFFFSFSKLSIELYSFLYLYINLPLK